MSEFSVFALLDDPVRRKLYDYVIAQDHAVSRSEAAAAVGIQRTLAAFHLDKLVETALLDVTFRRPAGRAGPGAGRPAKLYRRGPGEHLASVPPRADRRAAELLAEVAEVTGAEPELQRVARSSGATAGRAARRLAPAAPAGDLVMGTLTQQGYQPYRDGADVRLRNCPFSTLAHRHPPLICGMNLALVEGLLEGAAVTSVAARLDPRPEECCVALRGLQNSKNNDN